MKKKQSFLIFLVAFALLIGGAYLLYGTLSQKLSAEQLKVQESRAPENSMEPEASPGVTQEPEGGQGETEKVTAPDFTVYDKEGGEVHLSDYRGKPVVLNFWASWCGPCKMEMPEFNEVCEELGEEIQFLMVNMTFGRETMENALALIEKEGYTFPVFFDTEQSAAMAYGAYSLPTTIFIDSEGYGIAQAIGAIDRETLQRGIDMILPSQEQ